MSGAPQETGSRMHIFGDTLGSTIVVRGALHKGSLSFIELGP